jgi:tetratricopeptide (TPR) repeat protein
MKGTALIIIFLNLFCVSVVNAQGALNDIHYKKSLSYFNDGHTEEAIAEVDLFLAKYHNNVEGLMLRAFYYIQTKKPQKALNDYSKVLEIDEANMDALTNRALLFMELGEYQNALTDINARLANHPDDWSIYFDRGYCYGLNGDHDLAIKDFDKSISMNPEHAESFANRGYSKINKLSNKGLIRPAPEQCVDACIDLRKALALGDSSVTKTIKLYCLE